MLIFFKLLPSSVSLQCETNINADNLDLTKALLIFIMQVTLSTSIKRCSIEMRWTGLRKIAFINETSLFLTLYWSPNSMRLIQQSWSAIHWIRQHARFRHCAFWLGASLECSRQRRVILFERSRYSRSFVADTIRTTMPFDGKNTKDFKWKEQQQ